MRNRGVLVVLTSIIALLCLYYLSFTFVSRGVENDAAQFATNQDGTINPLRKQQYLDSVWNEEVFNIGIASYTYKEAKQNEVKLGLDLMGGMNVTMEVAAADILNVLSSNSKDADYQAAMAEARSATLSSQKEFTDLFYQAYKKRGTGKPLASIFANKNNRSQIDYNATDEKVLAYLKEEVNSTIDRSFEILRNRIDKFGVTQPNIQRLQGTNRILVELPGIDDPARVRKLLQGAAKLQFFQAYELNDPALQSGLQGFEAYLKKQEAALSGKGPNQSAANDLAKSLGANDSLKAAPGAPTDSAAVASTETAADTGLAAQLAKGPDSSAKATDTSNAMTGMLSRLFIPTQNGLAVALKDTSKVNRLLAGATAERLFPGDLRWFWGKPETAGAEGGDVLMLYPLKVNRNGEAPLEGDVITDARNDFDDKGRPEILMQMNSAGAAKWRRLTKESIQKRVAIVLDNVVYSAPVVQSEIPNGSSSISGSFTIEEAKDLANILKSGKMPVQTRIVEEVVVGPTLGAESISKGLVSIFVGFAAIIIFMVGYYASSGVVANIAVLLNMLLILGMLVQVDAVLTLPGIAGIVLTLGMAVDANVLINERVKDELEEGKDLHQAVNSGYQLAQSSIWDAQLTTAIAGLALLFFGTGPVQGFATTLLIGIATSLFTSVYITRAINTWQLEKGRKLTFFSGWSKNFMRHVNFDFVGKRKMAYIASATLLTIGLISLSVRGLNYGVDFSGGYTYIVKFDKEMNGEQVRQALTQPLTAAPEVKTYGEASKLKITTNYLIEDESEEAAAKVQSKVVEGLDKTGAKYEILSSSKVGATVAKDITYKSILAVIVAMAGIFGYIWLRFRKWQYGLGATIAVLHDTLVIFTVYSVCKDILPFSLEIDQNFVAAVLTIAGFSVNDTVVVFDRVREQLREHPHEDPKKVVNQALNFTFSRTIVTSVTVFIMVLILLVFGGETIRGLSFALLVGVITGAYSTIYIAVPFLIDAGTKRAADLTEPTTAVAGR